MLLFVRFLRVDGSFPRPHLLLRRPLRGFVLPPVPGLVLTVGGVGVAVLDLLPRLARLLLQLGHVLVHLPRK